MNPANPWWHPQTHADRRPLLHARARLMGAVRGWFDGAGFIEADRRRWDYWPLNPEQPHEADEAREGERLQAPGQVLAKTDALTTQW